MSKQRVFIVGPANEGDPEWYQVCTTTHKGKIFDIYQNDFYEEDSSHGDLESAMNEAKVMGVKRPKVL